MHNLHCVVLVVVLLMTMLFIRCSAEERKANKVLKKEKVNADLSSEKISVGDEVCARVCSFWSCTTYYCAEGVCCTPGSPSSLCCPTSYPLCFPDGCCPEGYSKMCGRHCCTADTACCENGCCDDSERCCSGEGGTKLCCKKDVMACCGDGIGCQKPCESQFDALPCEQSDFDFVSYLADLSISHEIDTKLPRVLYRVIRWNEIPSGIIAKNPKAERTVLSHVNCGSRKNYESQFISFTTSLKVAKAYAQKTGNRIVKLTVNNTTISKFNEFVDLTSEKNRDEYLGNAVYKNFAKASSEVVISSSVPIETEEIQPEMNEKTEL